MARHGRHAVVAERLDDLAQGVGLERRVRVDEAHDLERRSRGCPLPSRHACRGCGRSGWRAGSGSGARRTPCAPRSHPWSRRRPRTPTAGAAGSRARRSRRAWSRSRPARSWQGSRRPRSGADPVRAGRAVEQREAEAREQVDGHAEAVQPEDGVEPERGQVRALDEPDRAGEQQEIAAEQAPPAERREEERRRTSRVERGDVPCLLVFVAEAPESDAESCCARLRRAGPEPPGHWRRRPCAGCPGCPCK